MKPILTSLSPNTERDDVLLALRQLFSPWRWQNRAICEQLENALSRRLENTPVVLTSSGRSALYYALRSAGIGQGDEVIIQAFTCVTVPASVQWVGAHPVYADIDAATFNLNPKSVEQKITSKTKAIIVQHTLGIPAPLSELQAIAKARGILLIEDCAHALGATFDGHPVGIYGDVAIFSFGRDKAVSSVFGGAIASKNVALIERLRKEQMELPLPSSFWVIQQLLHPLFMALVIPTYFSANIGKALLVTLQKFGLLSKAVTSDEREAGKPDLVTQALSPALASLALRQLEKLPRFVEHRRMIAKYYREHLPASVKLPADDAGSSWLRFPILVDNPTALHKFARKNKILLGDWYNAAIAPHMVRPGAVSYQPGSCPTAEACAAQVVNLPTYPRLKDNDYKYIVKIIEAFHDSRDNR